MAHIDITSTPIRPVSVPGNLPSPSDLQASHTQLVARLLSIWPPNIVGEVDGSDIRNLSDYLVAIADAVDPLIETVGREAKLHTPAECPFDLDLFRRQLFKAIEGNALFEISEVADAIEESQSAVIEMWAAE